jgi:GTPase
MRPNIRSNTPRSAHTVRPEQDGFRGPGAERVRAERAVLVGVLLPSTRADLRNPLAELSALAQSAGVEVVDAMIQKRMSLAPNCAIGSGKLQELAQRVEAAEADVVIFDNDLVPRQIRGVEQAVGCKVIDRSELILDIFASRAKTRQAQLQVELAQLEYTAPRLRGMWTHLERIAGAGGATGAGVVGGVGTRGPGERQIEIDRRIVRDRISFLKREIEEIDQRKQREVKARSDHFTVSLVGYTNSGKSTLMNKLTGASRYAADQLFATLDTKTVRWELGEGRFALLSDTVGFVRDIPHHLVASFRATLEETLHADLLLHVVDASASNMAGQVEIVEGVLADLGCQGIPRLTLLNKIDIADHAAVAELLVMRRLESLTLSALTGEGLDRLAEEVIRRMQGVTVDVKVRVPHRAGKLLGELDRLAEIRHREYGADNVRLSLRINRSMWEQIRGRAGNDLHVENDNDPEPEEPTDSANA